MRIRFIYIYREKETGSAVYTGSAFDVGARDIQHCKGLLAFDKEIQRKGRDAFTLSAYFKTPEGREVHAAAMRKRNSDPLERAKQSVKAKAIWTPERREAWSIKMRGLLNSRAKPRKKRSPEARLCHSEAAKLYFQTEEGRASHSAAMKKRFSDPAERERQRATAKATWTPEKRLAWGVRMRAVKSSFRKQTGSPSY
jgi:predicted GIY-YIG superfamily endonuclease